MLKIFLRKRQTVRIIEKGAGELCDIKHLV